LRSASCALRWQFIRAIESCPGSTSTPAVRFRRSPEWRKPRAVKPATLDERGCPARVLISIAAPGPMNGHPVSQQGRCMGRSSSLRHQKLQREDKGPPWPAPQAEPRRRRERHTIESLQRLSPAPNHALREGAWSCSTPRPSRLAMQRPARQSPLAAPWRKSRPLAASADRQLALAKSAPCAGRRSRRADG